jgi:Fe-S oxidoreductase
MQAFREFKLLWDPQNKMNPGKLGDPVAVYEPHENLRLGAGYESRKVDTYFQFPGDKGSFAEATLRCVGVGACRKQSPGAMCPSYMATQEERYSTRGRAHLLWEMLEGNVLDFDWGNEHIRESLDLCLSCKACKSECPVNVDVATYKAEFLAHYHERHRHPLRDYAFGFMDKWAHLASVLPGVTTRLANLPLQIPGIRELVKQTLNIAPQRRLPQFASRSYQSSLAAANSSQAQVLLWPDTWNNYYHPQVLASAEQVLADAGFTAYTPREHVCCGRPLYDFGFLKQARAYLEKILHDFSPQIDSGMPIVFLEPSCASVFRDELLNFFPTNERAKRLSQQSFLLSEFLVRKAPGYKPPSLAGQRIVLHGHCHHKSLMKMNDELTLLAATGAEVNLLDAGCCGMAGPFGFEKEKYEVSQTLGERVLLPAVRHASAETLIVTDGFSCREQIAQSTSRRAVHFAEVISKRPRQHS